MNTNEDAKAICPRCTRLTELTDGLCQLCWDDIDWPEDVLYRWRKSWSSVKIVLLAFILAFGLATDAQPWTLTVKGHLTLAAQGQWPYSPTWAEGDPFTMSITTEPMDNEYVEADRADYKYRWGGDCRQGPGAPYTLKVTVNEEEFVQTEPIPCDNRSMLVTNPGYQAVHQWVQSNACQASYGFCVMAYFTAYKAETFLSTLSFDANLKLTKNFDPGSIIVFSFRHGPYTYATFQPQRYFYGTVDSLTVRQER